MAESRRGPPRANPGTPAAMEDQLELIFHAARCPIGDMNPEEKCPELRCSSMKKILYHLLLCDRGDCCDVEGCFETRQLKAHFRRCFSEQCTPCVAVRSRDVQDARATPEPEPSDLDAEHEKQKMLVQLLEFVFHIHKCRSGQPKSRLGDCGLKNCADLDSALLHLPLCLSSITCAFPGCVATRHVLRHWGSCGAVDCLLCDPIKLCLGKSIVARAMPQRRTKLKYFVSQHIEQLLHTLVCLEQDRRISEEIPLCPRINCESMKRLLNHLPECNDKQCLKPQCSSMNRIYKHWKTCSVSDCWSCTIGSTNQPNQPLIIDDQTPEQKPKSPVNPVPLPPIPSVYNPGVEPRPLQLDESEARALQRLLVLLLHAHKCANVSQHGAMNVEDTPCPVKNCGEILKLYQHAVTCKIDHDCEENNQCSISKQILHHWRTCDDPKCNVCFPLATIMHEKLVRDFFPPTAAPAPGADHSGA